MIDLHKNEFELTLYAQRYDSLSPKPSPQFQNRMEHNPAIHLQEKEESSAEKPGWICSLPQIISNELATDKAKGALVGLATGDAIGTTLEFLPRDKAYVSDMTGGGPFRLEPGEWTDDTSMALCLAETLIETGHMSIPLFRRKLVNWYKYGENSSNGICFDIGNTTRNALHEFLAKGDSWYGNTAPETAGNAGVIRQAPVSIFRRKSLYKTFIESKSQSLATHGSAESMSSCQYLGMILHHLLNGYSKEQSFAPHVFPSPVRVLLINAGEYKQKTREQIRSSGYVIDTLEAAMWAVWHTNNFRDAVLLAANLADDADSVAATTGQLAGALYGYSGIPEEWLKKLVDRKRIVSLAEHLFHQAPEED